MKVHLNLYAKLGILLVSIVTIPTMLLGYLSFHKSNQQIQTVTNAFLLDNLQHNSERVNALMERIVQQSEKVIASNKIKEALLSPPPQSLLEEYDFIRQMNPLIDELRSDYEMSIYPREPLLYPNYANHVNGREPWFLNALESEGKGVWFLHSVNGQTPTDLLYVRAIRDFPHLQTLGVMTLRLPRFLLANQLIIPERVGHLSFYMVDERGQIIASKTNPPDAPMVDLPPPVSGPESPVQAIKIGETEYYTASASLGKGDWRLVALIPVAELTGPVENIKRFTWLLVASGIVVMNVLLLIIVRKITVPIRTLVRHMKRIHLGDLSYCREHGQRTDEIGQLMRGYNSMITGMSELIAKTKQFEEEKRRLEIRSLIHQINPHFLYNTMDTIKWKAVKADVPDIADMVSSLSNLLRFSINNGDELTTVERELEHVKNYLSIELQRNHDAFSVMFQIQPNILHLPFMKLTLQPIVENAIKHAMKKLKEGTGKMIVSMYRTQDGGAIVCTVADNGPGIASGLPQPLPHHQPEQAGQDGSGEHAGVGLFNVDRRLKLKFGETYGISLTNRAEGGCMATLLHPVIAPAPPLN
ncbi:cache domain-containing sensor histidine kinase [Paenibacillus thalictri]|uniref:cache domain-containing sensor histidine kinase n=1 Tax=Paenibacillus thalictri TaxID=2527873 RepID=UPI0013EF039A|nr:sensor histidine kinase [Paenibacillus thalictri]